MSPDNTYNKQNVLAGTRSDTITYTPIFVASGVGDAASIETSLSNVACKNVQINNGIRLTTTKLADFSPTYSLI